MKTLKTLRAASLMPVGSRKGELLFEIPDSYFKWFWIANKDDFRKGDGFALSPDQYRVMEYIESSFEVSDF